MKKILITALLIVTTGAFAQVKQNENEKKTTTTTKTYVEDDKGVQVQTKKVETTESQDLALTNFEGKHNFSTVMEPVKVKTDVSYSYDDRDYMFKSKADSDDFVMMSKMDDGMDNYAVLRPSTQKGYYILTKDGVSSFGYFNDRGNFVVESYDAEQDKLVTTIYVLDTPMKKEMKKDKMK